MSQGAIDRALRYLEKRIARLEHEVAALQKGVSLEGKTSETNEALSWLFVRQTRWAPKEVTSLFDGLIIATRYDQRPINRHHAYWQDAPVPTVGMCWLPLPGLWRDGLAEQIHFLRDVGAKAFCINAEPLPGKAPRRWEGRHDEMRTMMAEARRLCDAARIETWVSSWANPSARKSFPWSEMIAPAHVCIPQPYEVHGRSGPEYVADVIAQWRDYGAKRIILGRGLHELDRTDGDAWRTPEQIREHRTSTPKGMGEAWWPPAGHMRMDTVRAAVE